MRCLLHGDESKEEVQRQVRRGIAHCVIAVVTARLPARSPDSVVSLCQMVFGGAAALRRHVLHSGGLLGVVRSVFLDFLSMQDRVSTATS